MQGNDNHPELNWVAMLEGGKMNMKIHSMEDDDGWDDLTYVTYATYTRNATAPVATVAGTILSIRASENNLGKR